MPDLLLLRLIPEQGAVAAALDGALAPASAARRPASARIGAHCSRPTQSARTISTAPCRPASARSCAGSAAGSKKSAPVTFRPAPTAWPAIEAALQDFLELEASGWKGAAGTAAVNDPAVLDFFRTAIVDLAAEGHARVDRLVQDGRVIAAAVTLMSGDTAWFWKIAYSEDLARSSPGVQLVMDCTGAPAGRRTVRPASIPAPSPAIR